MFVEDYINFFKAEQYKIGSTKLASIPAVTLPLYSLEPEDFFNANADTYLHGYVTLIKHRTVSVRSYIGHQGQVIELICSGEFDRYPFWDYEDPDDAGMSKLKSSLPGSAHVRLLGPKAKIISRLEEFIAQLLEYEAVIRKRQRKK